MAGSRRLWAALISAAFLFSGCASPDGFGGSRQAVQDWGRSRSFESLHAGSSALPLLMMKRGTTAEVLHVYIEGDGAAWSSPWQPPRDPTPERPVALALAANDPWPATVYLGRPCQYLDAEDLAHCSVHYWTSHRFSPEVVDSYQEALDTIRKHFGALQLKLFGYSGGGVLAMLLSSKRDDVIQVVTVASPISVTAWVSWHEASPLTGSLDPAFQPVKFPPSIHFVGMRDGVVPSEVVEPFAKKIGARVRLVPDFDHECCWSRDWQRLMEEIR